MSMYMHVVNRNVWQIGHWQINSNSLYECVACACSHIYMLCFKVLLYCLCICLVYTYVVCMPMYINFMFGYNMYSIQVL